MKESNLNIDKAVGNEDIKIFYEKSRKLTNYGI